ncbi:MAG: DNA replication and repair protein RecF [Firmicutes bacterium ADurb.Bin193]|nr:MAG: DNA replication and repair protein RecF [Firmicutes bacterium ADurb.Bin193]
MWVDEIRLVNFRGYKNASVMFDRGVNIIYGANASGKTNILEALFLMSAARSHRFVKENEMISFGCKCAKVFAAFYSRGRDNTGEITLFKDKKKQIRINGVAIDKTSELMGFLNAVMFCPEDLRLIKGAPRERRRMMDVGICQISKKYFNALTQYIKVLEQKNRLLKDKPDSKALWVWNEKLAELGTEVIWFRKSYIDSIGKKAAEIHRDICKEDFEIKYSCGAGVDDFSSKESILNRFRCEIEKNDEREKRFGISLVGPHRDDFEIFIDKNEARVYASQGQQRTAVLSVKMSEVSLIRENTGEPPVLLLDDVMSELDAHRQSYILNGIKDSQVIITCTEPFDCFGAKIINIRDVRA